MRNVLTLIAVLSIPARADTPNKAGAEFGYFVGT